MPELVEEWRPIAGYDGFYEVSNLGRVRSWLKREGVRREEPWMMSPTRSGSRLTYLIVKLRINGKQKSHLVSRLVCRAFHGEPPSPRHDAAHEDGNSFSNRADNLLWKTRAANHADKRRHGTHIEGERHYKARLTADRVREARAAGGNSAAWARKFGVSNGAMWCAMHGKTWKHV